MSEQEHKIVSCRGCGADIVFLKTHTGRKMPVNAETVDPGDEVYEWGGKHVCHFETCPQSGQFKTGR